MRKVKTPLLWDTHCHLQDKRFRDDLEETIERAESMGVIGVIIPGWDYESSLLAIEIARRYKNIYAAAGFHPHDSRNYDEEKLLSILDNEKMVAIGEIGLDFYRNLSPVETQKTVFRRQLRIAEERGLPVIIHTREALEQTIEIVKEFNVKGVFHAFTGSEEDAKKILELGFYVGIGGVLTFKNARLSGVVKSIPLQRILLETDAPYIAPHPHRGKRNEPAYLVYVFNKLCDVLGMPPAELGEILIKNTLEVFRIEAEGTH